MLIDNIREAILKLEKKNYKIREIRVSKDIFDLLNKSFNKFYGEDIIEIGSLITLFGYECNVNLFDDRQLVFITEIDAIDILGSDKE